MYKSFQDFSVPRGLISVIGSGGKTTLLRELSLRLTGTVILSTSTHMYPFPGIPLIRTSPGVYGAHRAASVKAPEMTAVGDASGVYGAHGAASAEAPEMTAVGDTSGVYGTDFAEIPEAADADGVSGPHGTDDTGRICSEIRQALAQSRVICVGTLPDSGKLSSPGDDQFFDLLTSLADYVLVEADGSKHLPLKAHRPHEPVIPSCTALTVCLAGASGIGKTVREVCHCPELFASLAETGLEDVVTVEHIARVLNKEDLADFYLISQINTLRDTDSARRLCELIHRDAALLPVFR